MYKWCNPKLELWKNKDKGVQEELNISINDWPNVLWNVFYMIILLIYKRFDANEVIQFRNRVFTQNGVQWILCLDGIHLKLYEIAESMQKHNQQYKYKEFEDKLQDETWKGQEISV